MSHNNDQYRTPPAGTNSHAGAHTNTRSYAAAAMETPPPNAAASAHHRHNHHHHHHNNAHLMNQIEDRMGEILDDADHKRCSEGNQRALLAEKLDILRQLSKELEEDEWMFAPKKAHHGLTLSHMNNSNTMRANTRTNHPMSGPF